MSEVIKDMIKAERLNEAFRYLFAHYGIETQIQLAERMKVQRTALSAAFNGNKAYLTKNFFIKLCAAFPDVFNLDYLLKGEGQLLISTPNPSQQKDDTQALSTENIFTQQNNMLELFASMIRGIDDLRQELRLQVSAATDLCTQLQDALSDINALRRDMRKAQPVRKVVPIPRVHPLDFQKKVAKSVNAAKKSFADRVGIAADDIKTT